MSTRCVTIVRQYDWLDDMYMEVCRLYRHCDGYPTGNGKTIAESIIAAYEDNPRPEDAWLEGVLGRMLLDDSSTYELESVRSVHSDIEYLYEIIKQKGEEKPIIKIWGITGKSSFNQRDYGDAIDGAHLLFMGSAEELIKRMKEEGDLE